MHRLESVLLALLLGLGALVVLDQANPFTTLMGRDSGVFAYIGSHLLKGETPYVFAWDHKPPLIYLINALGLLLTGGSRWGIWLMEAFSLGGAAAAAFLALRGKFGGSAATIACAAFLWALNRVLFGGNFTEEYALLFSFLALLIFGRIIRRDDSIWLHAALGFTLACNFLLRPNNAGVQAAIILTEALVIFPRQSTGAPDEGRCLRKAAKSLLATALGFALPMLAVSVWLAARGAHSAYVEAAYIYNLAYSARIDIVGALVTGTHVLGPAAALGAIGVALAAVRLAADRRRSTIDPWMAWLCIDAVLEVVLSALSGRNFVHYFINWLPMVTVATALLVHQIPPAWAARWSRYRASALALAFIALAAVAWRQMGADGMALAAMAGDGAPLERQDAVSRYVNAQTEPGETVFVWGGEAGIYFLSRREAATAHILYGKLGTTPLTDALAQEFLADMRSSPPVLIIDRGLEKMVPLEADDPTAWIATHDLEPQPRIEEFFALVHARYEQEAEVAGMTIYRRVR